MDVQNSDETDVPDSPEFGELISTIGQSAWEAAGRLHADLNPAGSESPRDPALESRLVTAALRAQAIRMAREEMSAQPYVALPVGDFLQSLCRRGHDQVRRLLQWAGLDEASATTPAYGSGWGRLAAMLGLQAWQATLCLRLSHAECVQPELLRMSLARARGSAAVSTADLDREMERAVSGWDQVDRERVQAAEVSMRQSFESLLK